MLEKDIQLQILKYLRAIGGYFGKTKTMGVKRGRVFCFDPYTMRGMPDILCFYQNKIYFIECKANKNKQSPEQITFQKYCIASGITYILAYDVQDVISVIK
jgi:hypothetical protein